MSGQQLLSVSHGDNISVLNIQPDTPSDSAAQLSSFTTPRKTTTFHRNRTSKIFVQEPSLCTPQQVENKDGSGGYPVVFSKKNDILLNTSICEGNGRDQQHDPKSSLVLSSRKALQVRESAQNMKLPAVRFGQGSSRKRSNSNMSPSQSFLGLNDSFHNGNNNNNIDQFNTTTQHDTLVEEYTTLMRSTSQMQRGASFSLRTSGDFGRVSGHMRPNAQPSPLPRQSGNGGGGITTVRLHDVNGTKSATTPSRSRVSYGNKYTGQQHFGSHTVINEEQGGLSFDCLSHDNNNTINKTLFTPQHDNGGNKSLFTHNSNGDHNNNNNNNNNTSTTTGNILFQHDCDHEIDPKTALLQQQALDQENGIYALYVADSFMTTSLSKLIVEMVIPADPQHPTLDPFAHARAPLEFLNTTHLYTQEKKFSAQRESLALYAKNTTTNNDITPSIDYNTLSPQRPSQSQGQHDSYYDSTSFDQQYKPSATLAASNRRIQALRQEKLNVTHLYLHKQEMKGKLSKEDEKIKKSWLKEVKEHEKLCKKESKEVEKLLEKERRQPLSGHNSTSNGGQSSSSVFSSLFNRKRTSPRRSRSPQRNGVSKVSLRKSRSPNKTRRSNGQKTISPQLGSPSFSQQDNFSLHMPSHSRPVQARQPNPFSTPSLRGSFRSTAHGASAMGLIDMPRQSHYVACPARSFSPRTSRQASLVSQSVKLETVLNNYIGCHYLYEMLTKELSTENLEFWKDVNLLYGIYQDICARRTMEHSTSSSPQQETISIQCFYLAQYFYCAACLLFEEYVVSNAPIQVNLPSRVALTIEKALCQLAEINDSINQRIEQRGMELAAQIEADEQQNPSNDDSNTDITMEQLLSSIPISFDIEQGQYIEIIIDSFLTAAKEIELLMNRDSFMRFKKDPLWTEMVVECVKSGHSQGLLGMDLTLETMRNAVPPPSIHDSTMMTPSLATRPLQSHVTVASPRNQKRMQSRKSLKPSSAFMAAAAVAMGGGSGGVSTGAHSNTKASTFFRNIVKASNHNNNNNSDNMGAAVSTTTPIITQATIRKVRKSLIASKAINLDAEKALAESSKAPTASRALHLSPIPKTATLSRKKSPLNKPYTSTMEHIMSTPVKQTGPVMLTISTDSPATTYDRDNSSITLCHDPSNMSVIFVKNASQPHFDLNMSSETLNTSIVPTLQHNPSSRVPQHRSSVLPTALFDDLDATTDHDKHLVAQLKAQAIDLGANIPSSDNNKNSVSHHAFDDMIEAPVSQTPFIVRSLITDHNHHHNSSYVTPVVSRTTQHAHNKQTPQPSALLSPRYNATPLPSSLHDRTRGLMSPRLCPALELPPPATPSQTTTDGTTPATSKAKGFRASLFLRAKQGGRKSTYFTPPNTKTSASGAISPGQRRVSRGTSRGKSPLVTGKSARSPILSTSSSGKKKKTRFSFGLSKRQSPGGIQSESQNTSKITKVTDIPISPILPSKQQSRAGLFSPTHGLPFSPSSRFLASPARAVKPQSHVMTSAAQDRATLASMYSPGIINRPMRTCPVFEPTGIAVPPPPHTASSTSTNSFQSFQHDFTDSATPSSNSDEPTVGGLYSKLKTRIQRRMSMAALPPSALAAVTAPSTTNMVTSDASTTAATTTTRPQQPQSSSSSSLHPSISLSTTGAKTSNASFTRINPSKMAASTSSSTIPLFDNEDDDILTDLPSLPRRPTLDIDDTMIDTSCSNSEEFVTPTSHADSIALNKIQNSNTLVSRFSMNPAVAQSGRKSLGAFASRSQQAATSSNNNNTSSNKDYFSMQRRVLEKRTAIAAGSECGQHSQPSKPSSSSSHRVGSFGMSRGNHGKAMKLLLSPTSSSQQQTTKQKRSPSLSSRNGTNKSLSPPQKSIFGSRFANSKARHLLLSPSNKLNQSLTELGVESASSTATGPRKAGFTAKPTTKSPYVSSNRLSMGRMMYTTSSQDLARIIEESKGAK